MKPTTSIRIFLLAFTLLSTYAASSAPASTAPADRVYRNGVVFTADSRNTIAQAIAIREGWIIYVGSNRGLTPFLGAGTEDTDLRGGFLMPGIIDGHMHPFDAGSGLIKPSLNYEALTVADLQQRIQTFLDRTASSEPDGWLEVVHWFQESMRPSGVKMSREVLDGLRTKRPIFIRSSYEHTTLVNTRALELAGITAKSVDPVGGKIWRDARGNPTGLLEDSALQLFSSLLPRPTAEENVRAAAAALQAMSRQGVTSFLDAAARTESIAAFSTLQKTGKLIARAHFAPVIEPAEASDPQRVVRKVMELVKEYDGGATLSAPGVAVRNAKLFLDGVVAIPALTGSMVDPYFYNAGTPSKQRWISSTNRGPSAYFSSEALARILVELGRVGIDPHLHADGDGAVRAALDGIAALRAALPTRDIRPAIAHDELVHLADFPRFKVLDATAVLSFQWGRPAMDSIGIRNYLGPARARIHEPAGFLAAAGVRIAFGSDWPVDALDEWFAFQVGVTRRARSGASREFRGRLGADPGLSPEAVLRAATLGAAYELHMDAEAGSIEVGKLADLIVLDRNPLRVAHHDIANVKVLQTLVGGAVVYDSHHSVP